MVSLLLLLGLAGWGNAVAHPTEAPFSVLLEQQVSPGGAFRVLVVAERPMRNIRIFLNNRAAAVSSRDVISGGPPFARLYHGRAPRATGDHQLTVTGDGKVLSRDRIRVRRSPLAASRPAPKSGIWKTKRKWTPAWERVFSAWVADLFRPLPNQANRGWRRLHHVTENKTRNLLFNRLGHLEDATDNPQRVRAAADCGDTPYFLRAYFAWKFELPFRYRRCNRGDGKRGPVCRVDVTNETISFDDMPHAVQRFNAFYTRFIAREVHSGTMRTLPEDNGSDFYPIALNRNAIRPGTVFVDSGGHALMVTQWDSRGLFAIDGHPDKTVTRRRFSPKFFRYFSGLNTGGFKAFRPIESRRSTIAPVPNQALRRFFSVEQYRFRSGNEFYAHMNQLIEKKQSL